MMSKQSDDGSFVPEEDTSSAQERSENSPSRAEHAGAPLADAESDQGGSPVSEMADDIEALQ